MATLNVSIQNQTNLTLDLGNVTGNWIVAMPDPIDPQDSGTGAATVLDQGNDAVTVAYSGDNGEQFNFFADSANGAPNFGQGAGPIGYNVVAQVDAGNQAIIFWITPPVAVGDDEEGDQPGN